MRKSRSYYCFILATSLTGILCLIALLCGLLRGDPRAHVLWAGPVGLVLLYLVSASWIVKGLEGGAVLVMTPVLSFALLIVAGSPLTALAASLQIAYSNVFVRKLRDERILFNIGQSVLSVAAGGWVYGRLGGVPGPIGQSSLTTISWHLPVQIVGAHLAYLFTNTLLVSMAASIRDRRPIIRYWCSNYLPMFPGSLSTPVCAYILGRLFLAHQVVGAGLFFLLMLLDHVHVREKVTIIRSRNYAVDTLLAISGATQPYTGEETAERITLAQEVGRHMGLSHGRMEVLRDAILLHNVGYVGVDPSTLRARGTLSEEQVGSVRKHSLIGARILLRVPSLREVAWVVLCHHERPDGQGYPLRLNAGEAPAEAYIVAVVEGYCSLKYGREHQRALGGEKAFDRIAALAGTRYDRAAVAALARAVDLPTPPGLAAYLNARPTRGDLHLKRHHLAAIQPRKADLSPGSLRLFASFPEGEGHVSARSIFRGSDPASTSPRERFRGHLFVASLSLFTLALLLFAQDSGPLAWASAAAPPLFWAALLFLASLLVIQLPAGASFTAASSVAIALAFIKGPIIGGLAGALVGCITHAFIQQSLTPGAVPRRPEAPGSPPRKPPSSREIRDVPSTLTSRRREARLREARARDSRRVLLSREMALSPAFRMGLIYGLAAAAAGLVARLASGPAVMIAALAAVLIYALIETASLSLWPPRSPEAAAPAGSLDFRDWESVLVRQAPLAPPMPGPLTAWERWRENYRGLFPEPVTYPAAGLLMALAYYAIGPWAVGVVFLYPVFWSHLRLEERLRLGDCRLRLLFSISQAIDERHPYTHGHSIRVGLWAGAIARAMGYPETYAREMRLAGALHDLGKASWTDAMLEKPRKLNPQENRLKEEHPVLSALVARASFPQVETAILQHHEDWDGAGYPHALEGPRLDRGARLLRVADTLDAVSSGRPYKLKEGKKDPVEEILRCVYSDFDPAPAGALACMFGRGGRLGTSPRHGLVGQLGIWSREIRAALGEGIERLRSGIPRRAAPVPRRITGMARRELFHHGHRVAAIAVYLGEQAGLGRRDLEALRLAALCHHRPELLRVDLWIEEGRRVPLAELDSLAWKADRLALHLGRRGIDRRVRRMVAHQSERWDGSGRPRGLRGEAIPLGARVLSLACALDRLLAPLPFRRGLDSGAAAQLIASGLGKLYDPNLAALLVSLVTEQHGEAGLAALGLSARDRAEADPALSHGILSSGCCSSRAAEERLRFQAARLRAWALDLGVAPEQAEELRFRYEGIGGTGPEGLSCSELPPLIARFRLEMYFLDLLGHEPRPLTGRVVRRTLDRMEDLIGWAASAEEIARFRRDCLAHGLPHTVAFAEWDRLSGGVELGHERARDEAILFSYLVRAAAAESTYAGEAEPETIEAGADPAPLVIISRAAATSALEP